MTEELKGCLLINKPEGVTSFHVVAVVRKLLNIKKVGHTGTLDPFATGVLPVMVGRATKSIQFLEDTDKEYVATFQLGITTDTQDITGNILKQCEPAIKRCDIEKEIENFRGEIYQQPPMYSAVKINGKRLYELARENIEISRPKRRVTVSEIKLLEYDENSHIGKLFVAVSKGTYIRTICNDLGENLGCGATTLKLGRTKACGFEIDKTITLEEATALSKKNKLAEKLIPIEKLFESYYSLCVDNKQSKILKNGGVVYLDNMAFDNLFAKNIIKIYDTNGFFALAKINSEKNQIKLLKQF